MPNTGKAGTSVSITNLQGSNFRHGAGGTTVKLTRSGQGDILAKGVTVASSSQIICSIPIPSGAAPGQWNVVVINPGGKSGILPNGFTITQAL
jgi:hypothetical protein